MEKRIKRILSISLSVLVSTLLVAGVAMAVTTLSENIATGGTLTVTGATVLNGGLTMDTDKFTVADTTGNTVIAGTLGVTGASTLTGALNANGGVAVDTTNFTVSGTTGAVHTAGDFDVATTMFTVASATGNTVVAGTLGVTGASTLTGALAANGGITVDTSAFAVADTTGVITLANGETIDNTTNGAFTFTGKGVFNGSRIDNTTGYEYWLQANGDITSTGDGTHGAKTYGLGISMTRPSGTNTANGDMEDAAIKASITNKATANTTSYILRGLNIEAANRTNGGNAVNELTGMYITGKLKNNDGVSTVNYLRGGWVRADSDPTGIVNTAAYGLQVDFDFDANAPADSAGVKAYYQSNGAYTAPLAAFEVSALTSRSWQYGLVIDANSVSTADIRLSTGVTVGTGTAVPATCVKGSIFIDTDDAKLHMCTATNTWSIGSQL